MISKRFFPQIHRTTVGAALAGLVLAVALAISGPRALAAGFPPTDGEMQGFTLLKQRVAAPTVPFQTGDGAEIDMTDFQGKVLIVNFWATWCAPCIKEMPSLDRLQAAIPDEDFEVVAINQDRGGNRVAEAFLRDKLGLENLDIYLDAKFALGRAYAIDRQGNIVGGMFGPAEWDSEDAKNLVRFLLDEKAGG